MRALGERFTEGSHKLAESETWRLGAELAMAAWRLLALEGERGEDGAVRVDFEKLRESSAAFSGLDEDSIADLLSRHGLVIDVKDGRRLIVLRVA